jgi:hypothetical protein
MFSFPFVVWNVYDFLIRPLNKAISTKYLKKNFLFERGFYLPIQFYCSIKALSLEIRSRSPLGIFTRRGPYGQYEQGRKNEDNQILLRAPLPTCYLDQKRKVSPAQSTIANQRGEGRAVQAGKAFKRLLT